MIPRLPLFSPANHLWTNKIHGLPLGSEEKERKDKGCGTRLEGFMDLVDPMASDLTEEMEDDMSSLVAGFAAQMCKRVANAQWDTTPSSQVFGGKSLSRKSL